MEGIPGILLKNGTYNVPWIVEFLVPSSDRQETGAGKRLDGFRRDGGVVEVQEREVE